VVATDRPRDIALLSYEVQSLPLSTTQQPLVLGEISSEDIGRPLLVLGYSAQGVDADGTVGSASAKAGVLSQRVIDPLSGRQLRADAVMDPGDSGGPVLDRDGKVVGMVAATAFIPGSSQPVLGAFYAVDVAEIKDALPGLRAGVSR
jgi:S1-C subfamily serine protease